MTRTLERGLGSLIVEPVGFDEALRLHRAWHSVWRLEPELTSNYFAHPEQWLKVCLSATLAGVIVAVLMLGDPSEQADGDGTIELRGMAISPDAPKNTGSKALARVAVRLKHAGWRNIVTYSMPHYKCGLYRGSSFNLIGAGVTTSGRTLSRWERRLS